MARLSFRCADELVLRVDAARGHEPREHWLRRAVERALGNASADAKVRERREELVREAEEPWLVKEQYLSEDEIRQRYGLEAIVPKDLKPGDRVEVRPASSSQVKRRVAPIPKGKPS